MTVTEAPPIACTLTSGAFKERLAWIANLNRRALHNHERRGLVLNMRYAPESVEDVRMMVRNEQACCSFLKFDLQESEAEIHLTITAPEEAREAANVMFEQFIAVAPRPLSSPCGCGSATASSHPELEKQPGTKAAGLTAVTLSTSAVACGACCVLPFALPATLLAGTGGLLGLFASMHLWTTGLAILAVVGAWGWIAWQTSRTRRRPAASTLYVMTAATALLAIAILWPLIERALVRMLVA